MDKAQILAVDDEPIHLSVLSRLLSPAYTVQVAKSGEEALAALDRGPLPDLVLLDILLPGIDGYETLERLRTDPRRRDVPVIFVTALGSDTDEEKGFRLGAVDYINKPFRPAIVLERVRVHLELKRSRDLLRNQNDWLEAEVARRFEENQLIQDVTLSAITQLAETRDTETANHIVRTANYVEILAKGLRRLPAYADELDAAAVARIVKASPLHDIGKVGIPDSILLKPGKLAPAEFEIMKTHAAIGARAIRIAIDRAMRTHAAGAGAVKPASLRFLEVAETIAQNHHERWDGTGYPAGLAGREIPLPGRLMALADVFDALTTPRVYKAAWTMEAAVDLVRSQRGQQFDPDVADVLLSEQALFEGIMRRMADEV